MGGVEWIARGEPGAARGAHDEGWCGGIGYRIDLEAACGLAVNTNQATSEARDHGPGELLHLLEANLHANGAISYLVGGPVSRMLVGVSTFALRLGIRPSVSWIRVRSPGMHFNQDGVTVTTAVTRAATQRGGQVIGSVSAVQLLYTRHPCAHATENTDLSHVTSTLSMVRHRPHAAHNIFAQSRLSRAVCAARCSSLQLRHTRADDACTHARTHTDTTYKHARMYSPARPPARPHARTHARTRTQRRGGRGDPRCALRRGGCRPCYRPAPGAGAGRRARTRV